jgi:hypothetical protein
MPGESSAKPCSGLPENKNVIAATHGAGAPTCGYSERITFAGAELLSSMAHSAAAQERNTSKEKHGTKKHYNI